MKCAVLHLKFVFLSDAVPEVRSNSPTFFISVPEECKAVPKVNDAALEVPNAVPKVRNAVLKVCDTVPEVSVQYYT